MTTTRITINGASGRMGRRLVALGRADKELEVLLAKEQVLEVLAATSREEVGSGE